MRGNDSRQTIRWLGSAHDEAGLKRQSPCFAKLYSKLDGSGSSISRAGNRACVETGFKFQ